MGFMDLWFDDNFATREKCPRATQLRYLTRGIKLGDMPLKTAFWRLEEISRRLKLFPKNVNDE